jgi:hypothetical protein
MPGLTKGNKLLKSKHFPKQLEFYSGRRVEAIFTKIPNCCHYPPHLLHIQGRDSGRTQGGRKGMAGQIW